MRAFLLVLGLLCSIGLSTAGRADEVSAPWDQPIDTLRAELLSAENAPQQILRLLELEQQALQLAVDQPLKLGPFGSAILDIYPASHTGHYVLGLFYDHIGDLEAKVPHDEMLTRLQADMEASGDGNATSPYRIGSKFDAFTYALSKQSASVGSIYYFPGTEVKFGLLLLTPKDSGGLARTYYDISPVMDALDDTGEIKNNNNPWRLVRNLSLIADSTAQTTIGAELTSAQEFDRAIGYLELGARAENVLANSFLARLFAVKANRTEVEDERQQFLDASLENHRHAIALGSTESMYALAFMYLDGTYGEEDQLNGVELLQQAGDLGHPESLISLGELHYTGRFVDQDVTKATNYYVRAVQLGEAVGALSYARFLLRNEDAREIATEVDLVDELETLADAENATAKVMLGNLYARGVATRASTNRAVRWYKRAVNQDRENADLVNEVAWTLTVSDVEGLKRHRYAKRIMSHMMEEVEAARARPEYLDTWAATYAATGDFDQAIELQEKAIAEATSNGREDVLDILQEHLEMFKAGDTITESAP